MRTLLASATLIVLLAGAPAARAVPAPEWTGSAGHSFAVTGDLGGGGWSLSLGALWPLDLPRVSFGLGLFADDAGNRIGRIKDVNDGTDLGAVGLGHRAVYGAAWRLDARTAPRRGWEPFGSATWGYYRVEDDRLGDTLGRAGSTGFSLAAGLRRPMGSGALGASLRYHRLANDVLLGRYVSAGLDWAWRGAR
jgi:opacity protein-like surface antigen